MRHLIHTLALSALLVLLTPSLASAQAMLLPKDPTLAPLALKHHRVEITVKDGTAVTRIEQVYLNATSRPLEATYIFPVPKGAVVMDFQLMIGGEMRRGEVLERDKAGRIYSDIVRRLRDPGIVDWLDKDLFRARIFPVPPRGEQKVQITYTQALPFLDGTYKLSYPLKTSAAAAKTLEDLTLTATISSRVPIKTVYSPSHKVSVARKGELRAIVGFEDERASLDRDFTLYFGVSKADVGLNLLTYREAGEPGFFMLMAAPKAVFDTDELQGKAITFVLDTSGSMTGTKLKQAKRALRWSLDHLGDDDRFNVIRFSSDVEAFEPQLVAASASNISAAKRFVDQFEAAGGTSIDEALRRALEAKTGQQTHLVLFITDGRPTVGETAPAKILSAARLANTQRARVFALGVGDDINTHLLDGLSDQGGGTSAYVKPDEDMDVQIAALYNQIAYPVLTDVALEISKVRTYATLPGHLPDIFRGGQLLVVGRYRGAGDALIRLTGTMKAQSRQFDFEGTFPDSQPDNAFIASLWAHRQVGQLLDAIRLHGETPDKRAEVIQLAKRYGIVTPYTSYLVVESRSDLDDRRPPPQPRPLRRGPHIPGPSGPPEMLEDEMSGALRAGVKTAEREAPTPMSTWGGGGEGFGAESGARAVKEAKVIRSLKDKKRAGASPAGLKHVSGRVFSLHSARGWVDQGYQPGLKELRIVPFSDAWIALVRALPSLKDAFALGERVTVRVGPWAIIVTPEGEDEIDAETLSALRRAAAR